MANPKIERQLRILDALNSTPSLRIAELARHLSVSTETIRRDLDELTSRGLLSRTYGGAVRPLNKEPSLKERKALYIAEREKIAESALGLIENDRVIMIGSGATTVHIARKIASYAKDITIITHSYEVGAAFSANKSIGVLMLPGIYDPAECATMGVHAATFLDRFYADCSILGASGLDCGGPSDALLESGAIYAAMIRSSKKTIIAADHSKFNRTFPARFASWGEVNYLVSDRKPDINLCMEIEKGGTVLTLC